MEETSLISPYYSKEQADALHRLRDAAGGSAFDEEWTGLIADIRSHMEAGVATNTPQARALAHRWNGLVNRFTGGNAEVERVLYEAAEKFHANCERAQAPVPNVLAYVRQVMQSQGE